MKLLILAVSIVAILFYAHFLQMQVTSLELKLDRQGVETAETLAVLCTHLTNKPYGAVKRNGVWVCTQKDRP